MLMATAHPAEHCDLFFVHEPVRLSALPIHPSYCSLIVFACHCAAVHQNDDQGVYCFADLPDADGPGDLV